MAKEDNFTEAKVTYDNEKLTIKSLPILLNVIENLGFDTRVKAEDTTIQVSLAVLYDLIAYIEQKKA